MPVRDPYPGNIIPANDPLRSQVAAKVVPLMAQPWRSGLSNNVGGNPNGDQTSVGDFATIVARLDHHISDKFKESTSFYWPVRPAIRNCGEVLGCTATFDPQKNSDYLGNGFFQRIATHHATQQFDYIYQQQPAVPRHRSMGSLGHVRQSDLPRLCRLPPRSLLGMATH